MGAPYAMRGRATVPRRTDGPLRAGPQLWLKSSGPVEAQDCKNKPRETSMMRIRGLLFGIAAAVAACGAASAQSGYPNQMVRIVVPFSAGSITDNLARILADKLGEIWKQQVIVENRAGLPGTTAVAKASPDGYTLMLTSNGHTIAGVINKNLQFDPVKDFAGVSQVAAVPMVMIVPPDFPAKTLQEFMAMAKQQPGKLNFSSAGVASTSFLSGEILRQNADVQMVHVPYK